MTEIGDPMGIPGAIPLEPPGVTGDVGSTEGVTKASTGGVTKDVITDADSQQGTRNLILNYLRNAEPYPPAPHQVDPNGEAVTGPSGELAEWFNTSAFVSFVSNMLEIYSTQSKQQFADSMNVLKGYELIQASTDGVVAAMKLEEKRTKAKLQEQIVREFVNLGLQTGLFVSGLMDSARAKKSFDNKLKGLDLEEMNTNTLGNQPDVLPPKAGDSSVRVTQQPSSGPTSKVDDSVALSRQQQKKDLDAGSEQSQLSEKEINDKYEQSQFKGRQLEQFKAFEKNARDNGMTNEQYAAKRKGEIQEERNTLTKDGGASYMQNEKKTFLEHKAFFREMLQSGMKSGELIIEHKHTSPIEEAKQQKVIAEMAKTFAEKYTQSAEQDVRETNELKNNSMSALEKGLKTYSELKVTKG